MDKYDDNNKTIAYSYVIAKGNYFVADYDRIGQVELSKNICMVSGNIEEMQRKAQAINGTIYKLIEIK